MTAARLAEIRAWHDANQRVMGRTALRCAAGCEGCVICHVAELLAEVDRLAEWLDVAAAAENANAKDLRELRDSVDEMRLRPRYMEPPVRAEVDSTAGFDRAPCRYTANGREAIDRIRDELGDEGFVAFCVGNALKYDERDGRKGDPSGDADKAMWYRRMAAHVRGCGPDPRERRPDFTPYLRPVTP